jgi:hypothetical protein
VKLSNLVLFNAILFVILGIAFALYGPIMINTYGILEFTEADGGIYWFTASFARLAGAALFGYGFLLWALNDLLKYNSQHHESTRKVILALLLSDILGLFVAVTQQWQVWINYAGWVTIGVFALLTIGYAYFLLTNQY